MKEKCSRFHKLCVLILTRFVQAHFPFIVSETYCGDEVYRVKVVFF